MQKEHSGVLCPALGCAPGLGVSSFAVMLRALSASAAMGGNGASLYPAFPAAAVKRQARLPGAGIMMALS